MQNGKLYGYGYQVANSALRDPESNVWVAETRKEALYLWDSGGKQITDISVDGSVLFGEDSRTKIENIKAARLWVAFNMPVGWRPA